MPVSIRLLLCAALAAITMAMPARAQDPDHGRFTALLGQFVSVQSSGANLVRYRAFAENQAARAELSAYLAQLQATPVSQLSAPKRKAFWINLYNALTLDVVLAQYPVATIKDISLGGGIKTFFTGGPWQKKLVTVEGEALSLDDIEHIKLRRDMPDARIHFAVNCAAIGCPSLQPRAFEAANLDAMLDEAAAAFINDARGVSIGADGRVRASRIFSWFDEDFGATRAERMAFLMRYAAPDLRARLETAGRISSYDYDWSLNDAEPPP